MTYWLLAILVVVSYFIGNVNFGKILSKAKNVDLTKKGSGNLGATNMYRTFGAKLGYLTMLLDALKGIVCSLTGYFVFGGIGGFPDNLIGLYSCGLAAVVGHIFPVINKFKGGKGISTFGGIIVFYDWRIALGGFIVFVLVAIISKYISMASSIGTFSTIIFCLIINRSDYYLLIFLTIVFVTITIKHIPNYKRLCKKEESRITILDHKHHKTN